MSRFVIVEGNNNDKDNVRAIMVKGEKGYSAYDIYVENGGTLTEEEWLDAFLNADNFYSKSETDNLLDDKSDKSTTLAGYGITDAYTKNETYSKTEIGDLSELETTDKSSLVSATNEIVNFLNLNTFETITSGSITGSGTISNCDVTVAKNSDGSLAKIYGQIDVASNSSSGDVTIQTSLAPSSSITINGIVYRQVSFQNYVRNTSALSMTINPDGTVDIPYGDVGLGSTEVYRISIFAGLIFVKDFGDIPIGE